MHINKKKKTSTKKKKIKKLWLPVKITHFNIFFKLFWLGVRFGGFFRDSL